MGDGPIDTRDEAALRARVRKLETELARANRDCVAQVETARTGLAKVLRVDGTWSHAQLLELVERQGGDLTEARRERDHLKASIEQLHFTERGQLHRELNELRDSSRALAIELQETGEHLRQDLGSSEREVGKGEGFIEAAEHIRTRLPPEAR